MTPYYSTSDHSAHVYHCSAQELASSLSHEADLVLTDFPYGSRTKKGARGLRDGGRSEAIVNFDAFTGEQAVQTMDVISALTSRWLVAFMDWEHVHLVKDHPPRGFDFVRMGIWHKIGSAPQLTGDRPGQGWEALAILHRKGRKSWRGGGHHAVWTHQIARPKDRPKTNKTEKPEPLIGELIDLFADPGGLVIDPLCGTGTTLIAARNRGHRTIGCDVRESECATTRLRLRQTILPGIIPATAQESFDV